MKDKNGDSWSKVAMSASLKKLLRDTDRNMSDLSRDLKISFTTVSDWVNGRKYPRPENVERLAHYFGVTTVQLLNLDDPTTHPASAYLGGDLTAAILSRGYTIDLSFSSADMDFYDLTDVQSKPVEIYRITDTRTKEAFLLKGDDLRKFKGEPDRIFEDLLSENKKSPDTLIDVEGLSAAKRNLVMRILDLSDEEVQGLSAIVDQVLALRGK